MTKFFFISGIGTDVGKTVVTGLLAKEYMTKHHKVITCKPVQTGSEFPPEDIVSHRKAMGVELFTEDIQRITCPYVFKKPSSPHLAAAEENEIISPHIIKEEIAKLNGHFDIVLVEGAGGLMVPLSQSYTTLDLICELNFPLVLVTHAAIGSISATLLNLEVCKRYNVNVELLVYNTFIHTNDDITNDSEKYLKQTLKNYYPDCDWRTI